MEVAETANPNIGTELQNPSYKDVHAIASMGTVVLGSCWACRAVGLSVFLADKQLAKSQRRPSIQLLQSVNIMQKVEDTILTLHRRSCDHNEDVPAWPLTSAWRH